MERIRSAFFLDFDNIYGGMYQLDRDAAYALADAPGRLLEALATRRLPSGGRRDLLVLRAYLNPAGFIQDSERGNDTDRLYLSRYRPNLTRSGFEVVDCPALTYEQKNAADIRIVIDVLQRLNAKTYYDEFIVASSDADFTPLLQHLRASDRRTTIISTGTTAPAYRNIASVYPNVAINVVCHAAFSRYFKDLMVGIAVLFNLTCGESERQSKIDTRSCEIGDLPTIG